MDKFRWRSYFQSTRQLPWSCPSCNTGELSLQDAKILTAPLAQGREDEDNWIYSERFTCIAHCNRPTCKESVCISGIHSTEHSHDEDGDLVEEDYYAPHVITPAPLIIAIPSRCPSDLRREICSSFPLYWSDARSCANRIRSSVELILTLQGIKRRARRKGGGLRQLSLHERIVRFENENKDLARSLLAVKWIGNEGSHLGELRQSDLLDAYEILEYVLDELYASKRPAVSRLVREINKSKKPRSFKKRP